MSRNETARSNIEHFGKICGIMAMLALYIKILKGFLIKDVDSSDNNMKQPGYFLSGAKELRP